MAISKKRRICVVTGTRAEYGLLVPVMQAIDKHPKLQLQLLVTGMHLLPRFGRTIRQIQKDGWRIDARVRLQSDKDSPLDQAQGLGRAITAMARAFDRLKTDIVVVLGDRIEPFAAAAAATASGRVIGHIHGGDAAPGVFDDAWRPAISKLSHLHFAAGKDAARRLKRLAEPDFRIYQTGSPALDNLSEIICNEENTLSNAAGFDIRQDFLMVAQHPAGGTTAQEARRMKQTIQACVSKSLPVIILYPNSDPGFSGILKVLQDYGRHPACYLLKNVPRGTFLGLLQRTRALVGNSSGGIIEAGALNVDVINVGHRQQGRARSRNVVDADYGIAAVSAALDRVLGRRRRRRGFRPGVYGDGRAGERIADILGRVKMDERLRQKRIVDVEDSRR
ncbi:MAG: UDP-N-acetylglucosamine 2-epimerase (hydrolyzing) [Sedimentisphaerales bacterium]|nr:UDP-N-acetylglucosamine 2-epimerase (hydrolyzing) [Sedimentisphaerales bacterium]